MLITPVQALSRPFVSVKETKEVSKNKTILRGFKIANIGLFIENNVVMELLDMPQVIPLPMVHQHCLGLINLRGMISPVFDIRLSVLDEAPPFRWILMITEQEQRVAFVIDDLPVQIAIDDVDHLDSIPNMPSIISPFISSGFRFNENEFYFKLDYHALLNSMKL